MVSLIRMMSEENGRFGLRTPIYFLCGVSLKKDPAKEKITHRGHHDKSISEGLASVSKRTTGPLGPSVAGVPAPGGEAQSRTQRLGGRALRRIPASFLWTKRPARGLGDVIFLVVYMLILRCLCV